MSQLIPPDPHPEPRSAAAALARLGFLARSDIPDGPGPAYLLVGLRPAPTLHHFDPEVIRYWAGGPTGTCRTLTSASPVPLSSEFTWGRITIADRLLVTNEFLAFGGSVRADRIGDSVIVVFTSPVPMYRQGGHSQAMDVGADLVGAFFARVRAAISASPDLEARFASAGPGSVYAAFLSDVLGRFGTRPPGTGDATQWSSLCSDARRQREHVPDAWRRGVTLSARLRL